VAGIAAVDARVLALIWRLLNICVHTNLFVCVAIDYGTFAIIRGSPPIKKYFRRKIHRSLFLALGEQCQLRFVGKPIQPNQD